MSISTDIWNEILQYVSKYPKYKGISKNISSFYKPQIDESYIYSEYKKFNEHISVFKYQINKVCLKKEFHVIRFMLSKVWDQIAYNKLYILYTIGILHRFGQFDMCKSILEEYMNSYNIKDLYCSPLRKTESSRFKYNFLICIYHLQINKNEAIKYLNQWKSFTFHKVIVHKYVGYINSFIYNYMSSFDHSSTIKVRFQASVYDIDINTHLDIVSYLIENNSTNNFSTTSNTVKYSTFNVLMSTYPATSQIYDYLSNLTTRIEKQELLIGPSSTYGPNPVMVKMFRDKVNLKYNHTVAPIYEFILDQ